MQTIFNAAGATVGATGNLLQRIMNWFQAPGGPQDANGDSEGQAALRQLQEQLGGDVPPEMIEQLLQIHLDEAAELAGDGGAIPAELGGLGMVGGWDYYEEAANADSYSDDNDSMPELESLDGGDSHRVSSRTPSVPRNPHAAMVEEAEDDEDDTRPTATNNNALLRHVDSDEDSDGDGGRPSTTQTGATIPPPPPPPAPAELSADPVQDFNDPQRLQRWLLTTGLTDLQARPQTLGLYVARLKVLRKQQQDWVVNMVRQRAGAELADKVGRELH
jgi:hypothetical protein